MLDYLSAYLKDLLYVSLVYPELHQYKLEQKMFHLKISNKFEGSSIGELQCVVLFLDLLFTNQDCFLHWRLLKGEVSSSNTRFVTEQV